MSVPVTMESLRAEIDRHGSVAFLLSGGADGRPHCVQLAVTVEESGQLVVHPGRGTLANIAERPLVSLLWPPVEPGGYSLIVDATASGSGEGVDARPFLALGPTKAVLHRPAEPADSGGVSGGSDCVRVFNAAS